jgi:hypothetical protein
MWQQLIVAVAVLVAAAYAVWALLPATSRARLATRLARGPGLLAWLGARLGRAARTPPPTDAGCDACPGSASGRDRPQGPPAQP